MEPHRPVDHLAVALNAVHEFFNVAQRIDDPAAVAWERWFAATAVTFERVDLAGGRFMLYTHRFSGTGDRRGWCCS
jgi:hypothetical protein